MISAIAWIAALFFAINIGASGTAASMGSAYGAGAIKRRGVALALVAIAVFLGAAFGGGMVVKTISKGIFPSHLMTGQITIIIIGAACITLFVTNILGIPLSTSEVTVGSLVGVGVAYHSLYYGKVMLLMAVWLVMPFVAYGISYGLGKCVPRLDRKLRSLQKQRIIKITLTLFVIGAGCYQAFSAGMNNVANAVGPLVGAGLIHPAAGLLWGAIFVAIGSLFLGGRVLDTNAKKITDLSLVQGSLVSLTSGTLVILASVYGLPVPLTQATTMSILGVGTAKTGMDLWKKGIVKRLLTVWLASPLSALLVSYALVKLYAVSNMVPVLLVCTVVLFAAGHFTIRRPWIRSREGLCVSNIALQGQHEDVLVSEQSVSR